MLAPRFLISIPPTIPRTSPHVKRRDMNKVRHDIMWDMETIDGVEYLTTLEVAEQKGASADTVRNALHRGTLKGTRILGRWLITPADAQIWEPGRWGGAERFRKEEGK